MKLLTFFSRIFPFLLKRVTIETIIPPETKSDIYFRVVMRDSRSRTYECLLWPHELEILKWEPRDTIFMNFACIIDPHGIVCWRCN